MRLINTILATLLISSFFGACTRRQETPAGKAPRPKKKAKKKSPSITLKDYFPEFQVESVGMELHFNAQFSRKNSSQDFNTSIKLQSIVRLGEHDYVEYVIGNSGLPKSKFKTVYYRSDDSGVWKKESREGADLYEMPFPIKMNERWTSSTTKAMNYGIAKTFEDVDIGGKTYKDCLRIEYQITLINGKLASRATQVEHRAPGIGMIRSVIDYQSGGSLRLELKSVKKAKSS
ncbi:MAG: hypothetical protein P1V97_04740 [Planctomycetota bacterium]|nr:hypothetical protein [Planctomycetota bacterium]